MNRVELEQRTKIFAVRTIQFVSELPKSKISDVLGHQLLRSATSIGANYREANRAVSRNDFIHKVSIAEKEASETHYWLELLDEVKLGNAESLGWLLQEGRELLAIFTSIGKTSKATKP